MKIKGNITVAIRDHEKEVVIELRDFLAGVPFVKVRMNSNDFLACLGRLAHVPVEIDVHNLAFIGKKLETKSWVFPMKEGVELWSNDRNEVAEELAVRLCPKGWTPDLYFGSQDSFYYDREEKRLYAKTTLRRWVIKGESELPRWKPSAIIGKRNFDEEEEEHETD